MPKQQPTTAPNLVTAKRRALGWSMYLLAKRADTTPGNIARIERTEAMPRVDLAIRIAVALGSTVEELFPARPSKAA